MDLRLFLENGNAAKLARAVGVPPAMVSQWKTGVRSTSEEKCPLIESATEGSVTVEELRPDLPWHRIPDKTWPHPAGRPVLDFANAGKG